MILLVMITLLAVILVIMILLILTVILISVLVLIIRQTYNNDDGPLRPRLAAAGGLFGRPSQTLAPTLAPTRPFLF